MFSEFLNSRGLSLERMHALVQLSEKGSLIRAAGGDSGRQSRYSHYLRELSEFFGIPLTEKTGKAIRLTAAGEDLARIAREQLQTLQNFQRSVKSTGREWRIGAGDNLLQWLLIPSLGTLRRPSKAERFVVSNLRTSDIVGKLQAQSLDFGLVRTDAVAGTLQAEEVCVIRYVIIVPKRIISRYLSGKAALLECPHAAVGGEGQLIQRIKEKAAQMGGAFRPELFCDSLGQCLAAVRTGAYAAVLPTYVVEPDMAAECTIVDDNLDDLSRSISFIWDKRMLDVLGPKSVALRAEITTALRDQAEARGMLGSRDEN